MLTIGLRKLLGSITVLLFVIYLIPGTLLHELGDHRDDCDTHTSIPEGPSISTLHRHCDLLQLGAPELSCHEFSSLVIFEQSSPLFRAIKTIKAPVAEVCQNLLRGPPAFSA